MFEMFVFLFGMYAFLFGSVRLPWKMSLVGWRARIAGLFLMAPLPILILLGVSVSEGVDRETAQSFFGILELIVAMLGILAAALFAYLTRPADVEQSNADLDQDG
jgi:peptidoglycan/LPS O-acetylase OafA/YrhL